MPALRFARQQLGLSANLVQFECTSREYHQKLSRFLESFGAAQAMESELSIGCRAQATDSAYAHTMCRATVLPCHRTCVPAHAFRGKARVQALHTYAATEDNELSFRVSQVSPHAIIGRIGNEIH